MDLEPYYNFEGLADQISLEKNLPCSFTFGEMKFNTEAEIVLDTDWSADVRTEIPISFEDYMSLLSSPFRTDQIFLNGQKISVFISGLSSSSPGKAIINFSPTEEPFQIIGDNETRLSKVIFHLCNFKDRFGTSRKVIRLENSGYSLGITELKTAEWKVELHESKKADESDKQKSHDPIVTHTCCLSRIDGSEFDGRSADWMLLALRDFFTFSQGYFCPPVMPVGFDKDGKKIWALGSSPHYPVKKTMSWFDPHHSDELAILFPKFILKIEDERWRETLHSAIYWYARSNNTSGCGIDTGIIISQIAIERLAYEYSLDYQKRGDSNSFEKLTRASDKLRYIFSKLDLPQTIPDNFTEMRVLAKQEGFVDAPYFLTEIRNSMVHPDNRHRHLFKGFYPDAWRLGMWYLELTILRLCDYEGTYANRLMHERWIGQVEDVPWLKKET